MTSYSWRADKKISQKGSERHISDIDRRRKESTFRTSTRDPERSTQKKIKKSYHLISRLYPIARQKWKDRVSFSQNSSEGKRKDADSAKRDYTRVAPF